ncbi:cytochrome P450 [Gordonia sp. DT218]|uniref:cytochrome P450 n=1 Tax=Gordonia sp. DT218 TaxID=3416659 RepID=UPI003CEBDBFB
MKLRRAILRQLGASQLASLEGQAEHTMVTLLNDMADRGQCDYVSNIAEPFALRVLCDLLGLPYSDASRMASWVQTLLSDSSADQPAQTAMLTEIGQYVFTLIADRARTPGSDFVSALIETGDLTKKECAIVVVGMIFGGFESSATMLSKMVLKLLTSPDLWSALREDLDQVPRAIEELLRTISIAGGEAVPWRVQESVTLAGVDMVPGDYVMPATGPANLDPRVFDDPEQLRHLEVTGTLSAALVFVWAFTGTQGPWVLWSVIGLGVVLGLHALIDLRDELPHFGTRKLQRRVDTLSRTRRQAVDAQGAELRRIERDLHDGVQARLVALTMLLGRAEAVVAHEPKAAELVRAARGEANLAIRELRDLARGIAPPVLADRGLVAAVQSLTQRGRATLEVVGASDGIRPPSAVESAAYFVVAEALTNATKHATGAAVQVRLAFAPDALTVDVTDDGPGCVDQTGTGVQGLRARVEALDGTFDLTSPPGGPTHLHAEVPCA